jgi:hypothetical protein
MHSRSRESARQGNQLETRSHRPLNRKFRKVGHCWRARVAAKLHVTERLTCDTADEGRSILCVAACPQGLKPSLAWGSNVGAKAPTANHFLR